jgi:hypothetical protein
MGMSRSLLAFSLLVLTACAGLRGSEGDRRDQGGDGRYETFGTVLENEEHGPMLCLGAQPAVYPPMCGTIPISNWDWGTVSDEETVGDSIWGDYRLVGTFDGRAFTVEEVTPPPHAGGHQDPIEPGCPEPGGGWTATDESRTGEADLQDAIAGARGESDFSGVWVDEAESGPAQGLSVLSAAFTGDLDRHRADLAAVWGGPLCVVERSRTLDELLQIQQELLDGGAEEFGLQTLDAAVYEHENVVELGVVVVDDETREAVDARYGEGTVRLVPALTRVGE